MFRLKDAHLIELVRCSGATDINIIIINSPIMIQIENCFILIASKKQRPATATDMAP